LHVLLPAMAGMIGTLTFDVHRMAECAPRGFSLATDMADWLVRRGVPFSRAHDITGAAVRHCEASGIELAELDAEQLAAIAPELSVDVLSVLTIEGSVASRNGRGGTATTQVRSQLAELDAAAREARDWAGS